MASSMMNHSGEPRIVRNLAGEGPQRYFPIIALFEERLEQYLFIIF